MKPIRILHVVTSMTLAGIETLLMTIYRGIDRDKIQFDFLLHRKEEGYYDDEIKRLGGRLFYVRPLNPKTYFLYKKELLKVLRDNNYKIIHSHLNANSSIVLNIAKEAGINHRIAHSHIDNTSGGIKGILKSVTKLFINKVSTHRFACSDQAGKWLYGNKQCFQVFNNGIESSNFIFNHKKRLEIRHDLNIKEDAIVIGNIARFNIQKNHKFMIPLFASFVQKYPTSKLLLLGEGELQKNIVKQVNSLGLQDSVIFTGAVGNANEYLNAMDLFLFPSLFEGLGIVAIEAQVNGLPVVLNERLPKEIDITNLLYRLSLNDPIEKWISIMESALRENKVRVNRQNEIIQSGYDIFANIKFLESFYYELNQL